MTTSMRPRTMALPPSRRCTTTKSRARSKLGWIVGLILLVIAAAAAFWFLAPPELKARAGIAEAGESPLQLMLTTSDRQKLASGNELLAISGRVINSTDRVQAVPPIHAELRDPTDNGWSISGPSPRRRARLRRARRRASTAPKSMCPRAAKACRCASPADLFEIVDQGRDGAAVGGADGRAPRRHARRGRRQVGPDARRRVDDARADGEPATDAPPSKRTAGDAGAAAISCRQRSERASSSPRNNRIAAEHGNRQF